MLVKKGDLCMHQKFENQVIFSFLQTKETLEKVVMMCFVKSFLGYIMSVK